MTPKQRFVTAKDLHRQSVRRPRRDGAAKDAAPSAADDVKSATADRVATADEVREAGQRALTRWASLLKRLAE
jgi:hypothetical protein